MRRTCTEPGCVRQAFGRGLCSAHYQRARYHGQLPAEVGERSCALCGEKFSSRKWNADYCSKTCVDRARQERAKVQRLASRRALVCQQCGVSLEGKRPHAKFCSDSCCQTWRNQRTAERVLESKSIRPPCRGCGQPVPAARHGKAFYCSDGCKLRSRRHEAYGLTKDELDLLLAQHDACALCKTSDWGKKGPQVDHDHASGRVRAILCLNCNTMLGHAHDNPALLRAAADYLEGTWLPPSAV